LDDKNILETLKVTHERNLFSFFISINVSIFIESLKNTIVMKFIYYTNKVFFIITIALYVIIIFGMLMQILLGGVQVLLFLVLLFNYGKFSKTIKQHLLIYGLLTGTFLIFFFSLFKFFNQNWGLIIFIPMGIATYFTYIMYELKKKVL
jgi:hypothetical protein